MLQDVEPHLSSGKKKKPQPVRMTTWWAVASIVAGLVILGYSWPEMGCNLKVFYCFGFLMPFAIISIFFFSLSILGDWLSKKKKK